MEEIKNIIETLIAQHRTLQKDLGNALSLSEKESPNIPEINSNLKKFVVDLPEHLNLENTIFYPTLLVRMEENKVDTTVIKAFIEEMNVIGVVVGAFSHKYIETPLAEINLSDFKKELVNIISILNTRIELEESGVYVYWGMYK